MNKDQLLETIYTVIEEEKELLSDFDSYNFDVNFLTLESSNWGFVSKVKERMSADYECEMETKLGNKHYLYFIGKTYKRNPWKKQGPF